MCARTESCSRETWWCCRQPRAVQQAAPRLGQVARVDVGQALAHRLLDPDRDRRPRRARPAAARRARCAACFICSYSSRRRTSSARGSSSIGSADGGRGSSMRDLISISIAAISRYSAASSRLLGAHHLDVLQVLARELRHRDVEDVDVLLADQVEQQVERALEGLQEHLQRVGRDVEVVRQLDDRLAVDAAIGRGGPVHRSRSCIRPVPSPRARRAWSPRRARRAFSQPSATMFAPASGRRGRPARARASAPARRSIASITGCLHSRQPMPAVRAALLHPVLASPRRSTPGAAATPGTSPGCPGRCASRAPGRSASCGSSSSTASGSSRSAMVLP